MKLHKELELLHKHLLALKEIHESQPSEICFDAVETDFSHSQLSQLIPSDEASELLKHYTFQNSKFVHALPLCLAIIETLIHKTNLNSKIFSST